MRLMPSVARWVRHRRAMVPSVLLAAAILTACSSAPSDSTPTSRGSGESFEQHCADGRPALVDVAAHRRGRSVVVTWELPRVVAEPRTYRLLRRGPGTGWWDRVRQQRLPPDADRRLVDPESPPRPLQYAVVEVDACGAGPVCSPTGVGRRCAVAAVPARVGG